MQSSLCPIDRTTKKWVGKNQLMQSGRLVVITILMAIQFHSTTQLSLALFHALA